MPTDRRVVKDRARAIGGALAAIVFASNSATAAEFFSGKTIRVVWSATVRPVHTLSMDNSRPCILVVSYPATQNL